MSDSRNLGLVNSVVMATTAMSAASAAPTPAGESSITRNFCGGTPSFLEIPTTRLDEARFHQKAPKRSYLTKREAEILLSAIEKQVTKTANAAEEGLPVREARQRALVSVLAARDHAAFSAMIYAGLRIEEATALTLEDLSFARGEEEARVARGKGNKERVVPMSAKLKRSLKRYLKVRDQLLPLEEAPPPTSSSARRESG